MGESLVSFRILADPPPRLDKALARDVPDEADLSRSRIVRMIAEGAVRVSLGPSTTAEDIEGFVREWTSLAARLDTRRAAA